jgi:hypothetical protein
MGPFARGTERAAQMSSCHAHYASRAPSREKTEEKAQTEHSLQLKGAFSTILPAITASLHLSCCWVPVSAHFGVHTGCSGQQLTR